MAIVHVIVKSAQEQTARVRACNYAKFETGWNLPPVLKTCTVHKCAAVRRHRRLLLSM